MQTEHKFHIMAEAITNLHEILRASTGNPFVKLTIENLPAHNGWTVGPCWYVQVETADGAGFSGLGSELLDAIQNLSLGRIVDYHS